MRQLIQIYSLREDRDQVNRIQRATLETKDFGLIPDPWLFGSTEWWQALSTGAISVHTIVGQISRVFMSGHNDFAEFEIDDGESKTSWPRQTSKVTGSAMSRQEMADLYRDGARVRLSYVLQRFKGPVGGLGTHSKCVLEIWIENAA